MRLTLLGTGCPVVHSGRHGPAQVVSHGDRHVLIDCGAGVTHRMVEAGLSGRDIDALILTHLHSDHLVDFYQLVVSSWHQGRDRPQRVIGPPGTRAFVHGTMALWASERAQRIAHEQRPSTKALEIDVEEIEPGDAPEQVLDLDGLTISAFRVDHRPVRHAFGFVCEAPGERLVISGDTKRCDAVVEAARGADLLLHEVFVHRDMPAVDGVRTEAGRAAVASYHTCSSEVGKIAVEAGVGALILTHIVPPAGDRDALLAEVTSDFAGPVIVGEDLMAYDVGGRALVHGGARIGFGTS